MSISTTNNVDDKREKLRKMRDFHMPTFKALGIDDPFFLPKLAYRPPECEERCIAFFASEIAREQDIYVEFAGQDLEPQDPERRLYKWRYNYNFREEYVHVKTNSSERWYIPVAELIVVKSNSPDIKVEEVASGQLQLSLTSETNPQKYEDILLKDASLRDLACVLLKVPSTNKAWLNELIKESKK